jgi:hypothetical protein
MWREIVIAPMVLSVRCGNYLVFTGCTGLFHGSAAYGFEDPPLHADGKSSMSQKRGGETDRHSEI